MRKYLAALAFMLCTSLFASGQKKDEKIRVFIDCSNTWCDMTFIKTEINIVDFLLDRIAADVHVLITAQATGNGGSQYQLIFYGQNQFRNLVDTLRYSTDPNATSNENRDQLARYLKLGLVPYIARTNNAKNIGIEMKLSEEEQAINAVTKDKWNYWVFRIGANGNLSADKNYKSTNVNSNFSATRVTDEIKIGFEVDANKNNSSFEYEDATGISTYKVDNSQYEFEHYLVKSITQHWSYGYEGTYYNSTFSNFKSRVQLETGIEYNVFPYSAVNNKLLTFQYKVNVSRNKYYDTTLYNKTKETLFGQELAANLSLNQKWGNIFTGVYYRTLFHNLKLNNLGINLNVNVRITGGLSFYMYTFGGLIHDQVYLPKTGATEQEVLTRRRQLESSYNFFTGFGISYRFGSKLNNFVNPRFEGGGGSF